MLDRTLRTSIIALCAVAVLGVAPAWAGARNQVGAVAIDSDRDVTTIRVRGSETPTFTVYKLERPTRVVVDLASAELGAAVGGDDAAVTYSVGAWAVGQVQAMALEDGSATVRVVATMARPGRYDVKADGDDVVIKIVARDPAPATASAADLAAAAQRMARYDGSLLAAAQRTADAAEFAFSRGATTVLELLDARRTLRAVQLEALAARADHARALHAWQSARQAAQALQTPPSPRADTAETRKP